MNSKYSYRLRVAEESKDNDYGYSCGNDEYRVIVHMLNDTLILCASHGETIGDIKQWLIDNYEHGENKRSLRQRIVVTMQDPNNDDIIHRLDDSYTITGPIELGILIKESTFKNFIAALKENPTIDTNTRLVGRVRRQSVLPNQIEKIFDIDYGNESFLVVYDPSNEICSYGNQYILRVVYQNHVQFVSMIDSSPIFRPSVKGPRWPECAPYNIHTQEQLEEKVGTIIEQFYQYVKPRVDAGDVVIDFDKTMTTIEPKFILRYIRS